MKTLLALLREPQNSDDFIRYLFELGSDLGTMVHLLYVENPAKYPLGAHGSTGEAMVRLQQTLEVKAKEAKEVLDQHVSRMMTDIAGRVVIQVSAEVGNEADLIREMVDNNRAHMLALENRQVAGLLQKDTLINELVRKISCPVWIIPENSEYRGLHQIIYATDYNQEDIPTLRRLIDLTRPLSPQIDAVHITDSTSFDEKIKRSGFQNMLQDKTSYEKINVSILKEGNGHDITDLLQAYSDRTKTDLIVVLKENRNFLERIFSTSTSVKMIEDADRAMLVFHEHN